MIGVFTPFFPITQPIPQSIINFCLLFLKKFGRRNFPLDYTQASNWFQGGATKADFSTSKVEYFTISIPKLKIDKATVAIGGEDLSEHIIQYPGTALPGSAATLFYLAIQYCRFL